MQGTSNDGDPGCSGEWVLGTNAIAAWRGDANAGVATEVTKAATQIATLENTMKILWKYYEDIEDVESVMISQAASEFRADTTCLIQVTGNFTLTPQPCKIWTDQKRHVSCWLLAGHQRRRNFADWSRLCEIFCWFCLCDTSQAKSQPVLDHCITKPRC